MAAAMSAAVVISASIASASALARASALSCFSRSTMLSRTSFSGCVVPPVFSVALMMCTPNMLDTGSLISPWSRA